MQSPIPVTDEIAEYLKGQSPAATGEALWADGTMPLGLATYLTDTSPPLAYISSVRCVLLRGDEVMLIKSADGTYHVTPGGRREEGESLEATVRRELLEETGWSVGELEQLGILHFHHHSQAPDGYPYPYPDFLWLVYAGDAGKQIARGKLDSWEVKADFKPADDLDSYNLTPDNLAFLNAALSP